MSKLFTKRRRRFHFTPMMVVAGGGIWEYISAALAAARNLSGSFPLKTVSREFSDSRSLVIAPAAVKDGRGNQMSTA